MPPSSITQTELSPQAEIAFRHISEQQNIAQSQLQVVGEETKAFPMLGVTYTLVTIFHDQAGVLQQFAVMVDPVTGKIGDDFNTIHAAESSVYYAKYGKLQPSLYERLQTIGDDEKLPIAIWVKQDESVRSEAELIADFIKLHPETEKTWKEQGMP